MLGFSGIEPIFTAIDFIIGKITPPARRVTRYGWSHTMAVLRP
jgi:hypothetical protein